MSERRMQSSFSLGQKRGGSTSISDPVTDRRSMLGSQIRNVLTKKVRPMNFLTSTLG